MAESALNQTPDATNSWIKFAPKFLQPYLQISRYDRPIGFWLLGLPCLFGQGLARINGGLALYDFYLILIWLFGSLAMRGAGCTINDILDRDIDAKVERTKNRPIASGQIKVSLALIWLTFQALIGLICLVFLPERAQLVALLSIPMVVLYPLMKRIIWWPQAWLGLTFNWGVLVGYAAIKDIDILAVILWLASAVWTFGYDTIYAMADFQDDEISGVKSSARKLGNSAPKWIEISYFIFGIIILILPLLLLNKIWLIIIGAPFLFMAFKNLQNQKIEFRDALEKNENSKFVAIFRQNKKVGLYLSQAFFAMAFVSGLFS